MLAHMFLCNRISNIYNNYSTLDCSLYITNSKLVSNRHCVLIRDDDGKVVLKDTSSNGTLVNGKLIKKNEVCCTGCTINDYMYV